ncbi:unnamed protein product, partial [Strongylus vulgaris]
MGDTSPDDDSSNESTSNDPLDFASLLTAFINNGSQLLNGNRTKGEAKLNRKRCAGSHEGTSAKRRNGYHENTHLEVINDEMSVYDPQLFFENGEDVACASGLVDSKAKNKVMCVEAILRREPGDSIIRDEDRDDSEPRTPVPEGLQDMKMDNDEVTAMIREAILRREPGDSIIRDEDRDDSEPRTPVPEGLQVDDRTCHLCWEES